MPVAVEPIPLPPALELAPCPFWPLADALEPLLLAFALPAAEALGRLLRAYESARCLDELERDRDALPLPLALPLAPAALPLAALLPPAPPPPPLPMLLPAPLALLLLLLLLLAALAGFDAPPAQALPLFLLLALLLLLLLAAFADCWRHLARRFLNQTWCVVGSTEKGGKEGSGVATVSTVSRGVSQCV